MRTFACLLLALVVAASSPDAAAQERAPLGTTLSGLTDWSTEFPFVDPFRTSRPWISGTRSTWSDGRALDLDERGWVRSLAPGQVARTVMYSLRDMRVPTGRWTVEYAGQGTLEYGGIAALVDRVPGRDTIEVRAGRGPVLVLLTSTDPSDPLREIRMRPPIDAPEGDLFHPLFLERLAGYSTIRFLNWMLGQVNNNIVQRTWDERPRLEDARWSVRGAPVEVMVALANRLGADPWFTMPHLADDDYVRRFAERVRDELDPVRRVYVEHSNEVWNPIFPQARYAQERGLALGLSDRPFDAQMFHHARRSREIFRIFEDVLGPGRVVRVLAMQAANAWWSERILRYEDTWREVDALAIAPYFGGRLGHPSEAPRVATLDLDDLFLELESVWLPRARESMIQHGAVASAYGLPLVAYEGGQHLAGVGPVQQEAAINALFDAANRDPRMGRLYDRYLADWNDARGGLFVHHTSCGAFARHGRFGALESLDQPRAEAPKYDALMRYLGR